MTSSFDLAVLHALNAYAGVHPGFDAAVVMLSGNQMVKAAPILCALWWLWAQRDARMQERRERILALLLAGLIAAALSVWLSLVLPLRPRPLTDPAVHFVLPATMEADGWHRVSSLPSDHASLYFALAGGMFGLSRLLGVIATAHVVLLVCLPRAYLGLHYATDLIAGAVIGLAITWLFGTARMRHGVAAPLLRWETAHASAFYATLFLMTYQVADLFYGVRGLMHAAALLFSRGA